MGENILLVIVGGIISIITLFISNWMELRKSTERFKSEVKREAFSKCIEGVTSALNVIGDFGNLNLDDEYINREFQESSKKISSALIIASTDTINELSSFISAFADTFFHLITKRAELLIAQSGVSVHREFASKYQKKIDELLEVMRRLNLEGNTDTRLWDTINRLIESDKILLEEQNLSTWQCNKELFSLQKSFIQELVVRMPAMGEMQINVLASLRKELGVGVSIDSLKRQMKINQERIQASLKSTIDRLDEMIADAERED